ncbi:SLAP domain-containing protein [Paenisporosarcina sp. NPDC076898]|uniref:SLAP domain-containing protein n=1 Tax=unclassified Paenisporosarcina TaxID=2642018 RepID=UPI003D04296C
MENKTYKTELDFNDSWELVSQEKYVFQFFHQQLTDLEANQIHIHGVKLYKTEKGMVITGLLRHSLAKNVMFDQVTLIVKNEKGIELAKKTFDMELFGELGPQKARPWKFAFEDEHVLVPLDEIEDQMAFELLFEHHEKVVRNFTLLLDENWEMSLSEEQKEFVSKVVSSLDPIKVNEVSVTGFHLNETPENVNIFLLVRNAFSQTLTIDNLPLQLFDARGDLISKLGFPIGKFQIPAHQARPISLSFSRENFLVDNPDFTSFTIELVPQQL